jgi:peptide chain release factor 3
LHKGLDQLSEEGATQVFRPLEGNDVVLGAVGVLQFDVAAHRLRHEYGVDCTFEAVAVATARWVICDDSVVLREFTRRASAYLALDGGGALTYIAPNQANLRLVAERWPRIKFSETKEI